MGEMLLNKGWSDEARAASLAVRQAKAAARKGQAQPQAAPPRQSAADKKREEAEKNRNREETRKRLRAKERDQMFDQQRKRAGDDFVDNWYPRGQDGAYEDPHYGRTSKDAPYGYVEGTNTPRREPLYDRYGRPIIPRTREDYHPPWNPVRGILTKDETLDRDLAWIDKKDKAEKEWGPFGRKKEYMDRHPGATDADWEKHDRERYDAWKKAHPSPPRVDSGSKGKKP